MKEFSYILGVNSSAKTIKGVKVDVNTGIVYLSPYDSSGKNVCPKSSAGCRATCLHFAGRAKFDTKIHKARIGRTNYFYSNRLDFIEQLRKEIKSARKKYGDTLAIRLNGTSDLSPELFKSILQEFSDVQFYDYTKVLNRVKLLEKYPNYHLTLSYSEELDWQELLDVATKYNLGIAVPFADVDSKTGRVRKNASLPQEWRGLPVFDADETDARFLDRKLGAPETGAYIAGLRVKRTTREREALGLTTRFFVEP
jgi:hypothetical protein